MALYIARDKNNDLTLFHSKPRRHNDHWVASEYMPISNDMFPDLTWDDEPKQVSLMLRDLEKTELDLMDDKIKELESLNYDDWDGYGALPIDKKAIENLKALFRIIVNWDFKSWQIFPDVQGGIYLNYKLEYPNACIIIGPDEFTYVIETDTSVLRGGTNKFNSQEIFDIMNDIHNISQNKSL